MNIQGDMLDHDIQEELCVNQCTSARFCAEVILLSAYRLLGTNDMRLNVPPERGAAFQERLVSCHYSLVAKPFCLSPKPRTSPPPKTCDRGFTVKELAAEITFAISISLPLMRRH